MRFPLIPDYFRLIAWIYFLPIFAGLLALAFATLGWEMINPRAARRGVALLGGALGTLPAFCLVYYAWWLVANGSFLLIEHLVAGIFHPGSSAFEFVQNMLGLIFMLGLWLAGWAAGAAGFFAGTWMVKKMSTGPKLSHALPGAGLMANWPGLFSFVKWRRGGTSLFAGMLGALPGMVVGIFAGGLLVDMLVGNFYIALNAFGPGPFANDPLIAWVAWGGLLYGLGGFWFGLAACSVLGFVIGVRLKNRFCGERPERAI